MKLPSEFLLKMEELLGAEFPRFLASYEAARASGLRANPIKISPADLKQRLPFLGDPVPWTKDGFYYNEEEVRPAKHPYYYAGLYYIQEPSAMLPAELVNAQPGERILDLCAAPGGKSVQLAGQIGREGLLVANDIHPQRAKVLLKNLERYGIVNALVFNETPARLADVFAGFFDKVLVDAPCSGEGMFRKEPEMAKEWTPDEVEKYARWQSEILQEVPKMLKTKGEIVYSTCTFSPEENEQQVDQFLSNHPNFTVSDRKRLWPHEVRGEGHFAAKLVKSETIERKDRQKPESQKSSLSSAAKKELGLFSSQVWGDSDIWKDWIPEGGTLVEREGHILWELADLPNLKGLKILRSGWLIGILEKGRFRPSQAFALGLPLQAAQAAVQRYDLEASDEQGKYQAIRYLRGETIQVDGRTWKKGWHLVCLDGFPLGWAKGAGNLLKNEYPPGWRWED